uniref:C-type lectin domain-containing protein n=1 Tax=Plectus sambesii TaxID=2011161 RepID=A0A914WMX3_9BILA
MWRIAILMFVFIYPRTVHATGACDSNPCLNGALCEPASYDSNSFQCETNCPSNCYGQQCETCVAASCACASNPCQNGATCELASYDSSSFQCEMNCPSNCYGQQCEVCVPAASVCASCPSGFTQAVPGSCFAISPGSYSFIDADAYCISVGGRLATVNDATEDYEIRRVLGDGTEYMPFWIGSGDPNSIGAYTWIDGSSSTYSTREHISGYCCTILKLGYMAPPLQWFLFQCIEAYQAMCRLPCGASGACASNPCQNGATCELASYDSSSFQCETNCPSNCYGQLCEVCVPAASVCASCPSGFTQAVPGSCFAISPGSYSFIDADAYCISVGGRLATVNDATEDYEIRRVLGDGTEYMPFWIGSGDPNSIGAYTWIDGSSSTYSTREHISGYCCTILKLGYMAPPLQWFLFQCIEAYQAMCRLNCGSSK